MAFNTGNPVPSNKAEDLSDNAENLDSAVNSTGETWTDRLGVVRQTVIGATNSIDAASTQGLIDIAQDVSDVEASADAFDALALDRVNKIGVIYDSPIRDWSASLLVDDLRAHRYPATTGDIYIPKKALPFTTGATFEPADWNLLQGITDGDIINDLSQAYTFKTVAQMKADTTILPVDKKVFWQGYNSVSDGGSNWGVVKSGPHTDDGGEFFTLNDGKHVQANLKGEKVNCRKFNVFPNVDGTAGMLSAIAAAKRLGSLVYVPAAMNIGDFYEVNAQMDLTACGIVGDGRDSSRIKTNSGSLPAILQRGDGALTLYTVMKGVYIRNNGGTGDGVSWDLAPRHNYMTDVKIYGYRQGAAVRIKDSTWITDMDDVFLDNCKWGLYFDRTQSIGNVGGSHTFRGGAIEGCERAFEGDSKNLAFYGTTIEGNQGIQETFANNTRVGGVCKLGVGEGPVSFQDCWMEGNGLPAIITGVGSTSEASATAQVTVNGGRHQAEKLIWIMGNTSQISIRDINFDYTPISRNALIWVNSREARVLIENIRYRNDYQRVYDPYNYNYLPRTVMLHEGGSVLFPQNINGEVFAGSQASLKKSRLDNVSFEIVLDDFVQGSGITRTF